MAQWDVYVNPVARSREWLPYLVAVQSDFLDALPTRLVIPLSRSQVGASALPSRLVPTFEIQGEVLALKPHEMGVMLARDLRAPVQSLRLQAHRLVDAMDAVVSGV